MHERGDMAMAGNVIAALVLPRMPGRHAPPPRGRDPILRARLVLRIATALVVLVFAVIVAWAYSGASRERSTQDTSSRTTTMYAISPTSTLPPEPEYMPRDGTYHMGGIDGKNWGIWESDGASGARTCEWSVRRVNSDAGADILDSGETKPGQKTRVDIEPDGEANMWTGEIGGNRIVFLTNGCQPWRWVP